MAQKKINITELKVNFNDISMRELGLDIDDNDHIYDMDTESIFMIKEKYIKYSEDEYPQIAKNEIELNLIENPRLMEILFGMWITKWASRKNVEVTSYYQSPIRGSNKGFFAITFLKNGEMQEMKSEVFINESVRVFSLISKLNHTSRMYDLSQFDIEIKRKDGKK